MPKKIRCTVIKSVLLCRAGDLSFVKSHEGPHRFGSKLTIGHPAVYKTDSALNLLVNHTKPGAMLDYYA